MLEGPDKIGCHVQAPRQRHVGLRQPIGATRTRRQQMSLIRAPERQSATTSTRLHRQLRWPTGLTGRPCNILYQRSYCSKAGQGERMEIHPLSRSMAFMCRWAFHAMVISAEFCFGRRVSAILVARAGINVNKGPFMPLAARGTLQVQASCTELIQGHCGLWALSSQGYVLD